LFVCLSLHIVEGMQSQCLCCMLPRMYHFPHQMLFSIGKMCEFIAVNLTRAVTKLVPELGVHPLFEN
jgi:hypothetical protein